MTLGDLIKKLEAMDPKTKMRPGFGKGRSWRGSYEQVAFEPVEEASVAEMIAHARAVLATTITGYKGGTYPVGTATEVNVARWGEYGGDSDAMDVWWAANVEVGPLRARVAELEGELAAYRRPGHDPTPAMQQVLSAITTAKSAEEFGRLATEALRQGYSEVSAAAWRDALRTFAGNLEEGLHQAAAQGIPPQSCLVDLTDIIMAARSLADSPKKQTARAS